MGHWSVRFERFFLPQGVLLELATFLQRVTVIRGFVWPKRIVWAKCRYLAFDPHLFETRGL